MPAETIRLSNKRYKNLLTTIYSNFKKEREEEFVFEIAIGIY